MAKEKLGEWVGNNIAEVKKLTRQGVMNATLLTRYQIFIYYSGLNHKSKMQRYIQTAEDLKVGLNTVRRAVSSMQSTL